MAGPKAPSGGKPPPHQQEEERGGGGGGGRPPRPVSLKSPGGTSAFELHVMAGPPSARSSAGAATTNKAGTAAAAAAASTSTSTNNRTPAAAPSSSSASFDVSASGASSSRQRRSAPNPRRLSSRQLAQQPQQRPASASLSGSTTSRGLLGQGAKLVRRLSRPFGRVHHIVGEEEEMRRHPSIIDRAPTARVTRFFLWRKWTIIVILLQMYIQVGIDLRNFSLFMRDPYESYCPCRAEVDAREKAEAAAAAKANHGKPRSWTAKSALGLAAKMVSRGSDYGSASAEVYVDEQIYEVQADGREAMATLKDNLDIVVGPDGTLSAPLTLVDLERMAVDASQDMAAAEGILDLDSLPLPALAALKEGRQPLQGDRRRLQEQEDQEDQGNSTDVNTDCEVCQLGATVAATGRLPSCYRYHASPGFNELIRQKPLSNEARVGLLAFRTVNSTTPVTLAYACEGKELGRLPTKCFQDDKILVRRNCSIGVYSTEYVELEMSTILARLTYAPSLTMRWSDCDPTSHTQTRDMVCLAGGKTVALGYCGAAGLIPPAVERECCTGQEDIYDTVYNSDYYNVLVFFDVVGLFVTFSRLLAMHLALRYIDQYKTSAIFVMWTWGVPFFGAFLKYSWPLNSFVSATGREGAIDFMNSLTGAEYVNNTALTSVMAEALQHSGGYDPIFLYLLNLIDALRSYAIYGQAFSLVTVEFYYRFLYALMVLGELGPLAVSVLPGFRSATVVLKTLLPESATLGWLVSFGPLVYMPFLACALMMFIQVFSDYWFTLAALFYSLSNLAQVFFLWRNSRMFDDPEHFRKQLLIQDMVRNALLAVSFALGVVFMVETAKRGQTTGGNGASATLKAIGPAGFLSFFVRVVFNFQLAAVFTADVTLYMLRKLQRQAREDRLANLEYERALKEFYVLDDSQDRASEDALERSLSLSQSATVAAMGKRTLDLVANASWQSADRVLPADDDYTNGVASPTGAGKTTKGGGGEGPVAVVGSAVASPVPSEGGSSTATSSPPSSGGSGVQRQSLVPNNNISSSTSANTRDRNERPISVSFASPLQRQQGNKGDGRAGTPPPPSSSGGVSLPPGATEGKGLV